KLTLSFSAAHLYHQKKWSAEKNRATFGACFTEHGHGHNYTWEVTLLKPRPAELPSLSFETWLARAQASLEQIVQSLDHQHLNFIIPEFFEKIPTTENIAIYLKEKPLQLEIARAVVSFRLF